MRHDFKDLHDLYEYATAKYSGRHASGFIDEDSQKYTYASFKETCDRLSGSLSNFGIGASDKVAILAENMPNWSIAFFAITAFGRIAVPMLPQLAPDEAENILRHSEATAIFVTRKQLLKLSPETRDRLKLVIDIEDFSFIKVNSASYTCDGTVTSPTEMDTAAIFYTSGTTGNAKGVMLSHRNLCANVLISWRSHKVGRHDIFLSILPMAHAYEMSIGLLYPFSTGARVYYLKKVPTPTILVKALKVIRPTAMLSVPLIIEKMYKSSIVPVIKSSKFLQYLQEHHKRILYFLIGFKLRGTFGGRLRFFGIGGAKLDRTVEIFLKRAGFPYSIGYGLTETAPLICTANPAQTHIGSTGRAAAGVQVRLDNINPETGEGEITVNGPNVMLGYYKDFERTRSVFTKDGWFRTGDLARKDRHGRYYIRGRIGSLIVGSSGENIYPEEIESVINSMEGIGESLVVQRDGKLVALVQYNENVIDWNLEGQDKFVEDIENRKKSIIEFVNSKVSIFSKIKDVEIQKEPFTRTATNKVKRFLYEKKQPKQ